MRLPSPVFAELHPRRFAANGPRVDDPSDGLDLSGLEKLQAGEKAAILPAELDAADVVVLIDEKSARRVGDRARFALLKAMLDRLRMRGR